MLRLVRPWSRRSLQGNTPFGPSDCLLSEAEGAAPTGMEHAVLMRGRVRETERQLMLHPYPRLDVGKNPAREGFPVRPRSAQEARTDNERSAQEALQRMNEVLARIQELEEALDDPLHLWSRLRQAWRRAENEADPRMAEIVKQAKDIQPRLRELEHRMRRVLRRSRELTPLDRIQEMDRASMVWLARQPGQTVAERAGASQRVLATVRRENFDTLENRVLHAYAILAGDVAREWLREHPRAKGSQRFTDVTLFRGACRAFVYVLADLGIGIAESQITPNYVLMHDAAYRAVYEAWKRLIRREKIIDDLWSWQAQTWTDFAVLAIVLALDEIEESELIAQSPIVWRSEAATGRWFEQDRPLAVFWLRETGRIVEIQSRPDNPGALQTLTRAHVSLRITDLNLGPFPRRVAVWTPHAMRRIDLRVSVAEARDVLEEIQRVHAPELLRNGLILTPGHGDAEIVVADGRRVSVEAIAFDASGESLGEGLRALRDFARGEIYRDAA